MHWGRKVLEVRPPVELNKGLGVTALLDGRRPSPPRLDSSAPHAAPLDGQRPEGVRSPAESSALRAALYVGDDATDLDAFRGLRSLVQRGALECAVCVAVRSDEAPPELLAEADLAIDGPDGVRELLEALL